MKVSTLVLNADGELHFKSEDQFDIKNLIQIAKKSEQNARERGAEWTAGAVSFFGSEVVKAVDTGEHDDVTKAIFQMLMASWVFDSLYSGLTEKHYLESDMQFIITTGGVVTQKRIDAVSKS